MFALRPWRSLGSLAASRRLVGLAAGLLCLVAAGSISADAPPAAPELVEGVVSLLDEGFEVSAKKLQAAQKRVAAVRQLADDDPRVDFAWGLVLVKQSQLKQALAQFEAGADRAGPAYWPAWQALIWCQLADRQYEAGLERLVQYAALVDQQSSDEGVSARQRDAARWMGEVLEALDRSVQTRKLHDLVDQYDAALREVLIEELFDAAQLGRDIVEERDLELRHRAGAAIQESSAKNERRRKSQASKLDTDLKDIDKQKEDAARSAEEWKAWLDDMLGKADKQLEQLEKQYKFLDDRAKSLDRSITILGQELTAIQMQMQLGGGGAAGGVGLSPIQQLQNEQQMIRRQNQMLNYQLEYNATISRLSQTAQQGRQATQQRANIVQRYEKQTGELVKKTASLDKWGERINDKKQKLDVSQPATKGKVKSAKAPAEKKIVLTFRNYLPLDLDAEKARVLADFGVQPAEPVPLADGDVAPKENAAPPK